MGESPTRLSSHRLLDCPPHRIIDSINRALHIDNNETSSTCNHLSCPLGARCDMRPAIRLLCRQSANRPHDRRNKNDWQSRLRDLRDDRRRRLRNRQHSKWRCDREPCSRGCCHEPGSARSRTRFPREHREENRQTGNQITSYGGAEPPLKESIPTCERNSVRDAQLNNCASTDSTNASKSPKPTNVY
mgnify:FL=1